MVAEFHLGFLFWGGGGVPPSPPPLNEILDSYNIYSAWYSVLPTTSDYSSGIIFQLEPSVFELLSRLEKKMSRVIKSVGNIEHEVYPALPKLLEYISYNKRGAYNIPHSGDFGE